MDRQAARGRASAPRTGRSRTTRPTTTSARTRTPRRRRTSSSPRSAPGEQPDQPRRRGARRLDRVLDRPARARRPRRRALLREPRRLAQRGWDAPHPDNLSEDTFALIVDTVRAIIDAVQPSRTYFTLEPMPWIIPDSPDRYLQLLEAIGRERFGVHLDPTNMINTPRATSTTPASCASASPSSARTSVLPRQGRDDERRAARAHRGGDPRAGNARLRAAAARDGPAGPGHADPRRAPHGGRGVPRGGGARAQRGRAAGVGV